MPFVSVIIPVYNTEYYLCKCIDSILVQTLSTIELILVDDGSTDNSGTICDQYACKDKRVHVIHTSNHGVSYARNRALEIAKGEYVLFVDSDDWIEPDMIASLYQLIQENHCDLSTCGYTIEDENRNIIYSIGDKDSYVLTKWDAIHTLFHDKYYKYKGNLWDKLYDKKIIDKNQLRFNENIYYNEDRLFIFHYLIHCQSIAYTTTPYYHYIIRSSSAMNSFENTYHERLSTFMDAFDIMTSLSIQFPRYIRQSISNDYIKSAEVFFMKNSKHISLHFFGSKFCRMVQYNYVNLSLQQKGYYTIRYARVLWHILFK